MTNLFPRSPTQILTHSLIPCVRFGIHLRNDFMSPCLMSTKEMFLFFNGFPGKKASLRMRANLLEKLPFLPLVVVVVVVVVSLSDSLKVMVPNS